MSTGLISVIDDDESVRRATSRLLKSMGFDVEVFSSAQEFLLSARLRDTSCLILDLRMPDMGGLELQSYLTAQGHQVPIIFHAVYLDDAIRRQALQGGAIAFLQKPTNEQELLDAILLALNFGDRI